MSYKSPIDIVNNGMQMVREQLNNQEEEIILKAVVRVGINVDKDELIKALHYDRNQYKKGYEDACSKFKWIPVEERLPEESLNSVIGWDAYKERCVFVQYYMNDWILGNHESVKIVAWMPLPEPYRKEVKEWQN